MLMKMNSIVHVCAMNIHSLKKMFSKIHNLEFNVMSNEEKLVYLTNHHWKELSIFIEKAWDKRNEICINSSMPYCHAH